MQADLLACPINFFVATVRDVDRTWLVDFNQTRAVVIEPAVVLAHDWVVGGGFTQLGGGSDASGNDRIRIDQAAVAGLDGRRRREKRDF